MTDPTYTVALYPNSDGYDVRTRSGIKDLAQAKAFARKAVEANCYVFQSFEAVAQIVDGSLTTGRTVATYRKEAGGFEVEEA